MLASGVVLGIAAAIAFGGDWRRLGNLNLGWWPLLVVASALRLFTFFQPHADLTIYVLGIAGIGLVAALNWRIPGAAVIAAGTFSNLLVIVLNQGMPYELAAVETAGSRIPVEPFYVVMAPDTRLPFLADVIPVTLVRGVFSIGDLLLAFGGFLIPFVLLQPKAEPSRHELRSANFAFFWLAQAISRFGDPITGIALGYVTYRATESALLTAIAVGINFIPSVFGFVGGAVADALGPRRAMFWCDIVRVGIVGMIPVLLAMNAPLVSIFALALLAGFGSAIFQPARGAIIPSLLTREKLAQGNSLVFATDKAVEIGGTLAAGALIVTVGEGAFYVDALTFALSAVLLARVVVDEEKIKPITWSALMRGAAEGARFIRRTTVVWSNTVFSLFAQFANPVVNTLAIVLLTRRFAGGDAEAGAVLFSGSEAAIAIGAVLGSAILPRYLEKVPKGRSLLIGFGATGVVIVLIAMSMNYTLTLALFLILGFVNVLSFVPTVTILQEATPQPMIARVFGARIAITNASWLAITVLGALVADAIGVDVFLAIAGLVTLATALVAVFVPAIRDVP
jgi:MFS family permease